MDASSRTVVHPKGFRPRAAATVMLFLRSCSRGGVKTFVRTLSGTPLTKKHLSMPPE